jgi:hypothetical protein
VPPATLRVHGQIYNSHLNEDIFTLRPAGISPFSFVL